MADVTVTVTWQMSQIASRVCYSFRLTDLSRNIETGSSPNATRVNQGLCKNGRDAERASRNKPQAYQTE